MVIEPLPPLMMSIPSKDELQDDIQEMKLDELQDPDNADYFKTRQEEFQKELDVLNDPKNAGIDPTTYDGAKNLLNQMNLKTASLDKEAQALLAADPSLDKYGWTMLSRDWITV